MGQSAALGVRLTGVAVVLALATSACTTTAEPTGGNTGGAAFQGVLPPPDAPQERAAASEKLAASDTIEVAVLNAPQLTTTAIIDARGFVTLPLVGEVRAVGTTTAQLAADVKARLNSYLQSPQVVVSLKTSPSANVTVDGEVAKPGLVPVSGGTTLLRAIALSGGLSQLASTSDIAVFRSVNGQRAMGRFDLDQIRAGQAPDPEIYGGDVVVVGASAIRTAIRNFGVVSGAVLPAARLGL